MDELRPDTCRLPTAKTGPKERAPPRRPFPEAGEDVSGKAFYPTSNLCSSCDGLWSVPGPLLDCQVLISLVDGTLRRLE